MSWAAVAGAAVGVGGSILSSRSANKGQQRAGDAAIAEQRRQFDLQRADQAPFMQAGRDALVPLSNLAMQSRALTAEDVMNEPGYQFGLRQGMSAIENSRAASGGLFSGAAGRRLAEFGGDYATTRYNDAYNRMQSDINNRFNRLASLANVGQVATNNVGQAGMNMANNVGNIGMGLANARGAQRIAEGNMIGGLVNQGISAWGRSRTPNQPRASFGPALDQGFTQGWD